MEQKNQKSEDKQLVSYKPIQTQLNGLEMTTLKEICSLSSKTFLKKNFSVEKIKESKSRPEFVYEFTSMLTRISNLAGIKTEIDDLNAQDITKMILNYFSNLSVPEIYKAFELERYGEYEKKTDHFQLFNAEYVSSVLNKYKDWKLNTLKQNSIDVFLQPAPLEKTEAEKEQIFKEFVTMVYNEIQEEGYSKDSWQLFFDLEKSGFIKVSNDEKHLMYKRELAKYTIEERKNIKLSNPINFKQSIKEFESQIKSKNKLAVVQNRCRSILVSEAIKQRCKSIEILFNVLNEIKKNEKSENAT